ncbi:zinc finger protein 436-like isoform X2 [Choloepus didactylus]|uniref:zinc finger protein 436-like isoform X2 n=1 Tax=Choloepus didactylus TaxID=27675 RepID=UPI00189D0E98|nr:zinc finger protein 436-like isoform X2 [Choloepus didactylus]
MGHAGDPAAGVRAAAEAAGEHGEPAAKQELLDPAAAPGQQGGGPQEQEWGNLEDWQKELYKHVMKGNYETLVSLDHAITKPELLTPTEKEQEAGSHSQPSVEGDESPGCHSTETDPLESTQEVLPWIKQEKEACGRNQEVPEEISMHIYSAEDWLVSKEKRSQGRDSHFPQPAWAVEGARDKEGLERDICEDPPLPGTPPGRPLPRERDVGPLPLGPQSAAVPAAGQCYSRTECPQSFDQKEPWAQHQRAHHVPRPFACPQCPKSFAQRANLASHSRVHTAERAYTCAQCGKSFIHQSTLTTHYRTHTGEKPYPCAECEKRFSRLSTLLEHRRTHTGEKPYQCAQCERRFSRLSTLVEHRRTHTGEKPFQCAQCEKRFTRLANLTVHQNMHSGERTFKCAQCGKRFAQRPSLLRHLRSHSQEKLYPCGQCGKSFICHSWLVRHQGSHASQDSRSCAACERGSPTKKPPAESPKGAVRKKPPSDPTVTPRSEGARTEPDHGGRHGGRQPRGGDPEGLGVSPYSSVSCVKMENAG